jgi:hypothetical protein
MFSNNVPGTVHDSLIVLIGNINDKLEEVYNTTGGMCTVDSSFACTRCPFLIKSWKASLMIIEQIVLAKKQHQCVNLQSEVCGHFKHPFLE